MKDDAESMRQRQVESQREKEHKSQRNKWEQFNDFQLQKISARIHSATVESLNGIKRDELITMIETNTQKVGGKDVGSVSRSPVGQIAGNSVITPDLPRKLRKSKN